MANDRSQLAGDFAHYRLSSAFSSDSDLEPPNCRHQTNAATNADAKTFMSMWVMLKERKEERREREREEREFREKKRKERREKRERETEIEKEKILLEKE